MIIIADSDDVDDDYDNHDVVNNENNDNDCHNNDNDCLIMGGDDEASKAACRLRLFVSFAGGLRGLPSSPCPLGGELSGGVPARWRSQATILSEPPSIFLFSVLM